jgi:hypothetical protein
MGKPNRHCELRSRKQSKKQTLWIGFGLKPSQWRRTRFSPFELSLSQFFCQRIGKYKIV